MLGAYLQEGLRATTSKRAKTRSYTKALVDLGIQLLKLAKATEFSDKDDEEERVLAGWGAHDLGLLTLAQGLGTQRVRIGVGVAWVGVGLAWVGVGLAWVGVGLACVGVCVG